MLKPLVTNKNIFFLPIFFFFTKFESYIRGSDSCNRIFIKYLDTSELFQTI